MKCYTQALPAGISLAVFNGDDLIFTSGAKWLHPLFALEEFLPLQRRARHALPTTPPPAAAHILAVCIKGAHQPGQRPRRRDYEDHGAIPL